VPRAERPILLEAATGRAREIPLSGSQLGIWDEPNFQTATVTLAPDDRLVLSSDGTVEARSLCGRELFGPQRMLRAVEELATQGTTRGWARAIVEPARQFAGGTLGDDACVLVARRLAPLSLGEFRPEQLAGD
jgi:serine phosphatase RsbU (regulator of sigma subunit)